MAAMARSHRIDIHGMSRLEPNKKNKCVEKTYCSSKWKLPKSPKKRANSANNSATAAVAAEAAWARVKVDAQLEQLQKHVATKPVQKASEADGKEIEENIFVKGAGGARLTVDGLYNRSGETQRRTQVQTGKWQGKPILIYLLED